MKLFCKHEWADSPWYVEQWSQYNIDTNSVEYYFDVCEDYICTKCKRVKTIKIDSRKFCNPMHREAYNKKFMERFHEKIRPRVEVKDRINDVIKNITH